MKYIQLYDDDNMMSQWHCACLKLYTFRMHQPNTHIIVATKGSVTHFDYV